MSETSIEALPGDVREGISLLDALLADQQRLQTPVARYAVKHNASAIANGDRSAVYADLIPLTAPGPGEQFAFEVDLDSCTGCKACVAACHSLNGLDENETWRDIGLLVSADAAKPFTQTVTTACHHCADPACLNGCPVLAYEKDPVTGIVQHLPDQCIGCGYCVLKCPYDVPKYNPKRGIVRKCDMCHGRLSAGEAPACVQACPTQAIRIVTVRTSKGPAGPRADTSAFLSNAPDPAYTQPTTRYVTKRGIPPNLVAADASSVCPAPPHWPLISLLTLVPMAVGCLAAGALLPPLQRGLVTLGWIASVGGVASSVLHLGRPLRAWRVFLGFRRSWLSREAMALSIWFAFTTECALRHRRMAAFPSLVGHGHGGGDPFVVFTAFCGAPVLFCCAMVYVDTRRRFWRWTRTAPLFYGAALVLGLGASLSIRFNPLLAMMGAAAILLKLAFEAWSAGTDGPEGKTTRLLAGPLRRVCLGRVFLGIAGGALLPAMIAAGVAPAQMAWVALGLLLAGELAERYLFFRAVDVPKMPGVSPQRS